jgi:hypothetical protein
MKSMEVLPLILLAASLASGAQHHGYREQMYYANTLPTLQ